MSMTSSRPYFIRALYEWIVDNNCTPHILVDSHIEGVRVPVQHVNKDGQIILNIAPGAINDFAMDNFSLSFSARFGGVSQQLFVPCHAILGIYARENGRGMMFEPEEAPEPPVPPKPAAPTPVGAKSAAKRPGLRVVK